MTNMRSAYQEAIDNAHIRPDARQEALFPLFDKLIEKLNTTKKYPPLFRRKKPSGGEGLYLWGGVGRGKSMLMDMFFAIAPTKRKRRVHFHAFMQEIHAKLHKARQGGRDDAVLSVADQLAKGIELLCLDEMQIIDITDAMLVGRLFERLLQKRVRIVATSNSPPEELYKDGLNRALFLPFIDMLNARFTVATLEGETDYRHEKLMRETRYFYPLTQESAEKIDTLWRMICASQNEEALVLKLKSRTMRLKRFCNGAARVDFDALCNRPLGAEDYLALSKNLRVLIIENIPLLRREMEDAARRFITLIDVAYDEGLVVAFSAEAPAEKLYRVGRGGQAFERTASRIYEMQAVS